MVIISVCLMRRESSRELICPGSYLPAYADIFDLSPGIAFREVKGKLYPSVGLKKTGEHVRVNFGQTPFLFDIDSVMKACSVKPPTTFVFLYLHPFCFTFTLSCAWPAFFYNMSDAEAHGTPLWLLDTFCDPIWQHDHAWWRRYPASAPGQSWDDSDDAADEFPRPGYPHSEPDLDRPDWFSPRHTSQQDSKPREPSRASTEATVTSLHEIMSRVADTYWGNRGWVLHLIIIWDKTNTNRFYRRRSGNLRKRSSRQIPPNSPHHSARRSSSSN